MLVLSNTNTIVIIKAGSENFNLEAPPNLRLVIFVKYHSRSDPFEIFITDYMF